MYTGEVVTLADLEKWRINHLLMLKYKAKMLSGWDEHTEFADWTDFLFKG